MYDKHSAYTISWCINKCFNRCRQELSVLLQEAVHAPPLFIRQLSTRQNKINTSTVFLSSGFWFIYFNSSYQIWNWCRYLLHLHGWRRLNIWSKTLYGFSGMTGTCWVLVPRQSMHGWTPWTGWYAPSGAWFYPWHIVPALL